MFFLYYKYCECMITCREGQQEIDMKQKAAIYISVVLQRTVAVYDWDYSSDEFSRTMAMWVARKTTQLFKILCDIWKVLTFCRWHYVITISTYLKENYVLWISVILFSLHAMLQTGTETASDFLVSISTNTVQQRYTVQTIEAWSVSRLISNVCCRSLYSEIGKGPCLMHKGWVVSLYH